LVAAAQRVFTAVPGRADGVISDLRDSAQRSAPALLLVLIGEFVLPGEQSAWSATLMDALGDLDVEPPAARKAIQRVAQRGTIASVKHGRRIRWSITDEGRALLTAGGRRVFEFTGRGPDWDGRWLVVNTSVPEPERHLRHQLRTRLTWCGLGSPAPGVWITPHSDRAAEVARIIADLGLDDQSLSYIGHFGPVGGEQRSVDRAWDLADLHRHYADFIARFGAVEARSDRAAFLARVELVQAWRRFPYLDPALPGNFIAGEWIGIQAARLFRKRRESWRARSQAYWNEIRARAADS
jgi:phenylacetic acid degradation operon negative regulatory protein